MSPQRFTVSDLAWSHIGAFGESADQRATDNHDALIAAFGGRTPPRRAFGSFDYLSELLQDAAGAARDLRSPFSGYLEAPPAIIDLYQRHGAALSKSVSEVHSQIRELMTDTAAAMYAVPPDRSVTLDEAVAQGFVPDPPSPVSEDEWP